MRTINVGLFGLGVVGCGVISILRRNRGLIRARLGADLRVTHAVTANPKKKRSVALRGISISKDPATILSNPGIDIVVELVGGTTHAKSYVLGALDAGKPVVTANKALLAEHAREIFGRVYNKELSIGFEASVAGGIPVLRSLKEGLSGDHIREIVGIVNGTSNYILSKMSAEGTPFAEVLAEAQRLGYAEKDPTFDVEGHDAAHKLAILVNLAYGTTIDYSKIYKEGISRITPTDITYARQMGYVVKLLAIGKLSGQRVEARVHPTLISVDHQLAAVNGVFNAVFITGDNVDATMSYGRGAGALPTGSAVVSDIIDLARNQLAGIQQKTPALSVTKGELRNLPVVPIHELESEYYLRFQVLDRVGVLASMTKIMGNNNISIQSMVQPAQADHPEDPVQVILITHRARDRDVQKSLRQIAKLNFITGPTQLIRIENFE
ncbi:MAG: homoserine dehydrogenase [SAR324 cluster bacterium]|nr:homoserine dehydrogenase [SAR324 cluster bacterium]